MFGIFRSKPDYAVAADAVAAFFRERIGVPNPPPVAMLSDRYCLGFLEVVGMHIASQFLPRGSSSKESRTVFERGLERYLPSRAFEIVESLSFIRNDEAFLRGVKDGDLYMGWSLLRLAPEREGRAAMQRFSDRLRVIETPSRHFPDHGHVSDGAATAKFSKSGKSVRWTDWQARDGNESFEGPAKRDVTRTYSFSGLDGPESSAELTIVCALEAIVTSDGASISLDRKLRFYLKPFRLQYAAEFVMKFISLDGERGGEFDVVAEPVDASRDVSVIAKYGGRSDVASCVAALRSGSDLVFMLRDQDEALVDFLLPNDVAFRAVYDSSVELLEQYAIARGILQRSASERNL